MLCPDVLKKLSEYLDAELDPTLAYDVARHVQNCFNCEVIVSTTRKTIQLYCDAEPAPLPPDVQQRLNLALASKLKGMP